LLGSVPRGNGEYVAPPRVPVATHELIWQPGSRWFRSAESVEGKPFDFPAPSHTRTMCFICALFFHKEHSAGHMAFWLRGTFLHFSNLPSQNTIAFPLYCGLGPFPLHITHFGALHIRSLNTILNKIKRSPLKNTHGIIDFFPLQKLQFTFWRPIFAVFVLEYEWEYFVLLVISRIYLFLSVHSCSA